MRFYPERLKHSMLRRFSNLVKITLTCGSSCLRDGHHGDGLLISPYSPSWNYLVFLSVWLLKVMYYSSRNDSAQDNLQGALQALWYHQRQILAFWMAGDLIFNRNVFHGVLWHGFPTSWKRHGLQQAKVYLICWRCRKRQRTAPILLSTYSVLITRYTADLEGWCTRPEEKHASDQPMAMYRHAESKTSKIQCGTWLLLHESKIRYVMAYQRKPRFNNDIYQYIYIWICIYTVKSSKQTLSPLAPMTPLVSLFDLDLVAWLLVDPGIGKWWYAYTRWLRCANADIANGAMISRWPMRPCSNWLGSLKFIGIYTWLALG